MFFFFEDLYYTNEDICQAFKKICLDKMLADGYFDMSTYIFGRIRKEDMYASLTAHRSKYAALYRGAYPKKDTITSEWKQRLANTEQQDGPDQTELTYEESGAIVNWIYRALKNSQEREEFTEYIFKSLKDLHHIQNNIRFSKGVVYNAAKVNLHFLSSVSGVNTFLSTLKKKGNTLFFRGHADANYILRPSIMRSTQLMQNESRLYHELLINCPEDFEKCHTHLEKLVKMQHYGLPTRLLDITRNPLVALYFACESRPESYGELILISAENHEIKYPQSDTVSVLASLPVFSYEKQQEFLTLALTPGISSREFNKKAARLIHEVRLGKPGFPAGKKRAGILYKFIVYFLKNKNRIIKQDGAFILCGLSAEADSLDQFRYKERGRKTVVLIEKKKRILEQLETFSINRASLFPEIECVAEYLKNKFDR